MGNLSTSLLLLVLAIVLLWLAVTDRLARLLDAYDVLTGKSTASASTVSTTALSGAVALGATPTWSLPSLPTLGQNAQVPA